MDQMSSVTETDQGTPRGSRERARTLVLVVLAVIATLFAVLNTEQVRVDWIIGTGRAPLIIVIVISALVGILATYLGERITRRRRSEP